jgi:dienelactone hydrolase
MELYNHSMHISAAHGGGLRHGALLVAYAGLLSFLAGGCQAPAVAATGTPAPSPVATIVASSAPASPVPVATATPSTAELMHPYTIAGLREHSFGDVRIDVSAPQEETKVFKRYGISYMSDGLRITGSMQVPVDGRPPFPAIVMNHGYFNREEYHTGDGTDRAAEYLNRHGYLTLSSDYRSWGGSDIGPSLYYSGLVIDVMNLINGVGSIPEADASRIGLWGHSMGGGVTMKVLMLDPPVKAAVLYSTVSADDADVLGRWGLGCIGDILAGEHQLGCNSSDVIPLDLPPELIKAYYLASLDPAELRKMSPFYHLDLVSVPIEIHYGTADGKTTAGTPPDWSRKLFDALDKAGKPVQIFAYDGEKHSFNGDAWIAFMERAAHLYDLNVRP